MRKSLLLIALMIAQNTLWADTWVDPETGRTWSYRVTGDTAEITRGQYSDWTGDLSIPTRVGDFVVTSIGDYAFFQCGGLSGSLTIPLGIKHIGACAFFQCEGLSGDLAIPDSVTNIGAHAFYQCNGISGSLIISSNVVSIGEYAFSNCSGLSSHLTLPNSVRHIGQGAFYSCSSLSGCLSIPNSVTNIGSGAFYGCRSLSGSLTIPNSLSSIDSSVFYGCSGLSGPLVIPDRITSIGRSAFYCCSGFSGNLMIPDSVADIGASAFRGCNGLSGSLELPNSVTNIGSMAFYNCTGLTGHLILPMLITEINSDTFAGCKGITGFVTVPDCVTNICDSAFWECSNIEGITIPGSVIKIGKYAFYNCTNLMNVTILDGVTTIDKRAFYRCDRLTSVLIPDSVTNLVEDILSPASGTPKTLYLSKNYASIVNTDWQIVRYDPIVTVSFDFAGGIGTANETDVKVATNYGTLPLVSREGYCFEGWSFNGVRVTEDTIVISLDDHTLVAQWKPERFLIGFDSNGGIGELDAQLVTFDGPYGELPTPMRVGYSFNGWFYEGEVITNATIVSTPSNHVLTAHWTVNKYPMTFNANGGNGGCTLLQEYDTPVVPPEVSRTGYSFVGWSPSVLTNVPAEALEFVAQWNANRYELSFDTCGGNETFDSMSLVYDGNYGELPTPTREGYSFIYWSLYGNTVNSDTVLSTASNHVLTAVWQGNEYGVTLDANGGAVEPSIAVVVYGDNYGDLPFAVRSGYSFEGWKLSEQLLDADTVVSTASNHTVVAQWTPCQYQVSFDADGGVLQNGQSIKTVTYDDAYGELPEATRVGYTFAGWALYGQKVLPDTMVSTASNHTLTACWAANRYVVELDPNGGSLNPDDSTVEVVFDSEYGELPCPERIGYSFAGWTASLVDVNVIETNSLATTNQILYALWEANPYQVVYEANNGSGETDSADAVYDKDVEIAANPFVWMGHVFVGWATSANGEAVYEPGQIVRNLTPERDGEVTLYAVWEPLVVAAPVITPGDGSSFVEDTCLVSISCATDGADIYFSTRGTPPRIRESNRYTGAFEISDTTCVMAIALKENITSEVAVVTISRRELTIPEAAGAMELTFETGGEADWVPMADVSAASGYSVRSGAIGCASYGTNIVTWLATEVEGMGTFSFRWKVDCEHDYTGMCLWDRLVVFTNGVEAAKIDGSQDWADVSLQFADSGKHSIRWLFLKDDEDDDDVSFEDCAWVSGVRWTPAIVVADTDYDIGEMPESVTVQPGVTLSVKVESEPTEGDIAALVARVTISPKSPEQNAEYFNVVGSYDAENEAVVLKIILDDNAIELAQTSKEVLDAVTDQTFTGGEVLLDSAKSGLYYGIVVVDDLSKIEAASMEIVFVKAGENGVRLTVSKPQGPTAFFKIVVSDAGNE